MAIKQSPLVEFYQDLLESGLFTSWQMAQVAVVVGALALAYLAQRMLRRRFQLVSTGGMDWPWVLFPLLAWLLVQVGGPLLQLLIPHSQKLLGVAELLLLAMFSIRVLVYLLRHVFTGAWLPRWERIIAAGIWIIYALHAVGVLPEIARTLDAISFHVGKTHFSLLTIIQGVFSVGMTLLTALWLGRVIERRLLAASVIDLNVRVVINKVVRAGLIVLAVMIALPLVGIDLTVLSVFGGALGVGLGFGLQKIASNYVSGFIILLDRSVKLGDLIHVDGRQGTVSELTSRYIVLKLLDGTDVLIPNEALVTSTVVNLSYKDRKIAVGVPVQVAYGTDLELALQLLVAVTKGESRIAVDPAPGALIRGFGDSGINLELMVWVLDPENGTGGLRSDLNLKIWKAFQAHGIEIPFPQREIRMIGGDTTKH